jgi:branched-chain amino acid transport system permease protein
MAVTTNAIAGQARTPIDVPAMLKEAAVTAFVVLGLAFGLVGFRTLDVPGGLDIRYRFGAVALCVAIAFFGRIAVVLLRSRRHLPVLIGAGGVALALLAVLLGPVAAGGEPAEGWLPFGSPVLSWALAIVAVVFAIRAARGLWHETQDLSLEEREAAMDRFSARVQRAATYLGPVVLAFGILLPFMPFADRRLIDIGILVGTYIMLGWGLNIVVGLAGLLDLGYVAFYAVGAYSYALLAIHYDLSFWICLPFAGMMAATAGVILGFPVLRLRGDYLAIVTLGFGEMIRIILLNWYELTKGPDGLSGIPRPSFFGIAQFSRKAGELPAFYEVFGLAYSPIHRVIFLYYVILLLALAVNVFTMRIRKLPISRAWEALREDETACRSLGINPTNTKLTAFGIGAMFGGFGGSFFATRQGFISPESFTFIESAVILAIVVLGGFGSQIGVVFAAILLIGLPEFFRDLQQYRMLAFGGAMVGIMLWRPAGLLAHREPTIRLHGKHAAGEPP